MTVTIEEPTILLPARDGRAALLKELAAPPEPEPEVEVEAEVEEIHVHTEVEPYEKEPILWHSNAPWVGSGYGTQTGLFAPLIHRELGHPLAFSAFYGLKGRRIGWVDPLTNTPFTIYPGAKDSHGNDVLGAHYKHFTKGKGWVILLSDVWVIKTEVAKQLPMLAWCPVDHDPVTPMTVEWFKNGGAVPIAMSKFGQEQLEAAGIKHVQYVPHGFDPAIFKPGDRQQARKALGLPLDTFMVGMVAANLGVPSRKSFAQALTAFSIFHKKHPDSTLYLHSILEDQQGESIPAMADSLGIRPYCADPYALTLGLAHNAVSAVHNAFDVLLNPATGEGFGVPLCEAQACGTPCITTNFSAMPEVAPVSAGNWTVGGQKCWTGFNSWQMTPNVEEIVVCLEEAYDEAAADREKRRESVYYHAQENYRADNVVEEHWKPVLDAARAEFAWRSKRMRRFT
jgi:glycosyltransferase involved in cell wall biosynthesis